MNTADVHSGWLPSVCIWEVIYWLLADLGEGNGEARGAKGSSPVSFPDDCPRAEPSQFDPSVDLLD